MDLTKEREVDWEGVIRRFPDVRFSVDGDSDLDTGCCDIVRWDSVRVRVGGLGIGGTSSTY